MYAPGMYGFPIKSYYANATPVGPVQFAPERVEMLYPIEGPTPPSQSVPPADPVPDPLIPETLIEEVQDMYSESIIAVEQAVESIEESLGYAPGTGPKPETLGIVLAVSVFAIWLLFTG
jgi:hypothetical protein